MMMSWTGEARERGEIGRGFSIDVVALFCRASRALGVRLGCWNPPLIPFRISSHNVCKLCVFELFRLLCSSVDTNTE